MKLQVFDLIAATFEQSINENTNEKIAADQRHWDLHFDL